jgi:hypothetical protein
LTLAVAAVSFAGVGIPTANAAPPAPVSSPSTAPTQCVAGNWTVTQSNVDNFTLSLTQAGSTVDGSASYNGSTSPLAGTINGNAFEVVVNWGDGVQGDYTATVSPGQMSSGYTYLIGSPGVNATWSAVSNGGGCGTPPTKDACKKDGWTGYAAGQNNLFNNQGDCVSYVASNGKSDPNHG